MIGSNGEGKSNLLEAVELLGSLRSHRSSSDRDLIQQGQPTALVRGLCGGGAGGRGDAGAGASQADVLELELRRQGGRQARRNGKLLDRQLDLVGPLRCVGFSALDLELVRGEPALRRQWLDRVVLQLEPVYAELLSRYGRLLRQRAQLLRRGLGGAHLDDLLDAFDQQMALIGTRLHRRRRRALLRLEPLAAAWQQHLSGGNEQLLLQYQPGTVLEGEEAEAPWREALAWQLRQQRDSELRLGQCGVGPHRDEIQLQLGGQPARRYGSAGQQRSLVLALKLAELELVRQLAELDPTRQQLLLEAVGQGEGYQCLVSATHLGSFSDDWSKTSQVIRVHRGLISA